MDKMITMEIPEQWLEGLEWEQSIIFKEIIQLGIYQFKVKRALEMYQLQVGSLGYLAEQIGISKRDLIREARMRGIEPAFDDQMLNEELGG